MKNTSRFLKGIFIVVFLITAAFTWAAETVENPIKNPVAEVLTGPNGLSWNPLVSYEKIILAVSAPDGSTFSKTFKQGAVPSLDLSGDTGFQFPDGSYGYELRVIPVIDHTNLKPEQRGLSTRTLIQSGAFTVKNGTIITPGTTTEGPDRAADVLHYDDVIITGSLCIGFDCANGEDFGYDTLKLKENNLRMFFEDTSTGSFPTTDWRLIANDTTSGGGNYFSIQDATNNRRVFTVEGGAPTHSLYVEDYGRVGLGTSIPYVELHIVDGDSPTIRLDQDGSSGWVAQSWDLCGNETNFFVRDVTNGSKLCFRIQPNTPSNTLCLKSDGKVGIGTWSPEGALEVETTGSAALVIADRTDGAKAQFSAGAAETYIGSRSNHKLHFLVNQQEKLTVGTNGYVGISDMAPSYPLDMGTLGNNARCTTGGVWQDGSSRASKENILDLSLPEAEKTLAELNPVKFNYKVDKTEQYVGFIAEDVPDLVAVNDRKALSPMDITAVLTKVVQNQQNAISDLKKEMQALKKQLQEYQNR